MGSCTLNFFWGGGRKKPPCILDTRISSVLLLHHRCTTPPGTDFNNNFVLKYFSTFFQILWIFLTFWVFFLDFLDFFGHFWIFLKFFWFLLDFFNGLELLSKLLMFLLKVTKVTAGHQKLPKMGQNSKITRLLLDTKIAKNGPKQHNNLFFCPTKASA